MYKIDTLDDDKDKDYFQTLKDISTERRLRKTYFRDPNDMDPQDVKEIFSDVLMSLNHWKKNDSRIHALA